MSARHDCTQRASRVEVDVDFVCSCRISLVSGREHPRFADCEHAIVQMASRHLWSMTEFEDRGCVGGDLLVIATFAGETAAGRTRIVF